MTLTCAEVNFPQNNIYIYTYIASTFILASSIHIFDVSLSVIGLFSFSYIHIHILSLSHISISYTHSVHWSDWIVQKAIKHMCMQ